MKYITLLTAFLFVVGCSKKQPDTKKQPDYNTSTFTGEKIPYPSPTEVSPKLDTYYAYSGAILITSFSIISSDTPEYKFYTQLFAGNIGDEPSGQLTKYSLRGGAIRWMRLDKKTKENIEVGRLTADTIVWYGPKEN